MIRDLGFSESFPGVHSTRIRMAVAVSRADALADIECAARVESASLGGRWVQGEVLLREGDPPARTATLRIPTRA